jgi:hypothetical protein
MSDVGFFGGAALSAGEAESIYNTPQVTGLTTYNLGDMQQLFTLFNSASGTVTIGSLNWQYSASLPAGYSAGQAWTDGSGDYYVELGNGTGVEALAPVVPHNPGDANGDGQVDINDLTIVLANYNQVGDAWSQGAMDGDPSGTVDINDLTIVLSNYGVTYTAGGPQGVPEPCAVTLLAAGLVGLLAYAWRRRR